MYKEGRLGGDADAVSWVHTKLRSVPLAKGRLFHDHSEGVTNRATTPLCCPLGVVDRRSSSTKINRHGFWDFIWWAVKNPSTRLLTALRKLGCRRHSTFHRRRGAWLTLVCTPSLLPLQAHPSTSPAPPRTLATLCPLFCLNKQKSWRLPL